ncbi:MAG: LPS translocon maturation chaperone LptM [Iodobacter sp.]
MMRALLILLTTLAFSACGFKGGLYLPNSTTTSAASAPSSESTKTP